MGLWRRVGAFLSAPFLTFSETPPRPIDQVILEMSGRGLSPRVSRTEALAVPGVLRGRNMIASIATLPLIQYGPRSVIVRNPLLEQIDPDVANVVTLAQTLEDLLFEGISWWKVVSQDGAGFPTGATHLDVATVSVDPPADRPLAPLPSGLDPRDMFVWVDGQPVPASQIIRFDSPNPGVLKECGRPIRRATLLDMASSMYAEDPRPLDYFTPTEGAEEPEDDEVKAILASWKAERKKRGTAWVPRAMTYNSVDTPSPQELQLVELQKQASLDIANALGIDPEDLGISTTSRTYNNAVDRRRDRINDVLNPYMRAVTDRLSMGDVTRRGHWVAFDLDDYMRANPTERWNTYQVAHAIVDGEGKRALSVEEIRAEEKLPPATAEKLPPTPVAPQPATQDQPTEDDAMTKNALPARLRLAADETLRFIDLPSYSFTVDTARRIIEGSAIPYGQVVEKFGLKLRFLPNSLQWNERAPGRVKLLRDHDMSNPIGFARGLRNAGDQLKVKFKLARGTEADSALQLAEDGVLDGMSVGIDFDFERDVTIDDDGVMNVHHAVLREVSLTAMPAFDDARVTKVAASRNEGISMEQCATCGQRHAADVACPTTQPANTNPTPPQTSANQQAAAAGLQLNTDQLTALVAVPGALQSLAAAARPAPVPATPPGGLTLSAEQLQALVASGQLGVLLGMPQVTPAPAPVETPAVVDPTRRTPATITATREGIPYRFDREGNLTRGTKYDFSTDLIAGSRGDGEALMRANKFIEAMSDQFTHGPARARFDVDVADAASLNPNRNRPDMYVDQKDFSYPIWDAISKGTLADMTPFVLPKFSSATGLVAAHTEGVEPTPGTFVATAQTITPSAVSGKVEITREAWDQGGNPQLSGIIWRQMTKAWFEALEAAAVTMLDALSPTGITLTTAAVDDQLTGELEAAIAALQFVRGGMRMRDFFIQIDLYKALAAAVDGDGRKLLPLLGPVNANGQVSDLFADLNIAGLRGRPAWALAATGTVAASSYLFDRNDVHGWATAPQRLEFQYRVAYVDVAIWGYKALANTDLTGVREVIYDPA